MSAPLPRAAAMRSVINLALPCRSPTIGLTWASATRNTRSIELNSEVWRHSPPHRVGRVGGCPPHHVGRVGWGCRTTIPVDLPFFERLRALSKERRTMLCVGLDPDPERIDGAAAGALRHCREVAKQTEEHACCFKPNSAFWEQYGPDGWKALIELHEEFADTPFPLHTQRGDMGNTMKAYAHTVFATLSMDAATVSPYFGTDSLEEFTRYEDRA